MLEPVLHLSEKASNTVGHPIGHSMHMALRAISSDLNKNKLFTAFQLFRKARCLLAHDAEVMCLRRL